VGSAPGAELLGAECAAAVLAVRSAVAERFRAEVAGRLRSRRPDLTLLLHGSAQPWHSTAFTGVDPATLAGVLDGLVVNCWTGPAAIGPATTGATPVYASLLAVAGMGGRPDDLLAQTRAAAQAGAAGVRLYHAGLASAADLAAIRGLTAALADGGIDGADSGSGAVGGSGVGGSGAGGSAVGGSGADSGNGGADSGNGADGGNDDEGQA
jgi:hypothetical protein